MTKITLKMIFMLGLLAVLIVSVAGCTSQLPTHNNQLTTTTNTTTKATPKATTHTTTKAATKPTTKPTVQPTVTPKPTATPTPKPKAKIPTTLIIMALPLGITTGAPIGCTYELTSTPGAGGISGALGISGAPVSIYIDGAYYGTSTTTSAPGGFGTFSSPENLAIGNHTISASFAGNGIYAPSSTPVGGFWVAAPTPTPTATPTARPTPTIRI